MFYCHPRQKVHCRGWHLAAKTAITTLGVLSESVSRGWHQTPKSAITTHGGIFPWVAPNAKISYYHSRGYFPGFFSAIACEWHLAPKSATTTHEILMRTTWLSTALTMLWRPSSRRLGVWSPLRWSHCFQTFYCGKLYFILFIYIYGSLCIRFYHFIECLFKCDGVWRMESTYVVFGLFVCRI